MKLFMLSLLITSTAILSIEPAQSRGTRGDRGDSQDYAIEYCRYYKTKAMFAGRKARANDGVAKYGRRANSLWAKYNTCLKDNGWPTTYRAPTY